MHESYPPDTGCDLHPSCLSCPLPKCRYDMPPKVASAYLRAVLIARAYKKGLSVMQIAEEAGVSRRTVFRARKNFPSLFIELQDGQDGQEA